MAELINNYNKWQPVCIHDYNSVLVFDYDANSLSPNILRFIPVQIGEWLRDLLVRNVIADRTELSQYVDMSRTRVGQFLSLAWLPVETKAKLRQNGGINEHQIRRFVREQAAMTSTAN